MKKLLTLIAVLALGTSAFSQCTINTSLTIPGVYPDTITNLPVAFVAIPYSTVAQIRVRPDTVTAIGTLSIQDCLLDSIVGLPANFSYSTNPVNGNFPGGTNGCLYLGGTAVSGQENGGPASDGVYPLIVYYTATVDVLSVPTDFPLTLLGYKLHIMAANGVSSVVKPEFAVEQSGSNPSDLNSSFRITAPNAGNLQFTMYSILGEQVRQESIAANAGSNTISVETGSLPAGLYLCNFRMGNQVVTTRITVSH